MAIAPGTLVANAKLYPSGMQSAAATAANFRASGWIAGQRQPASPRP